MNRIIILIAFMVILLGCEKQIPEPAPLLSEYIVGDWELREVIDRINFGDWEYHDLGPDYGVFYRFEEDQTYVLEFDGYSAPPRSYSVNEQDSILMLGTSPRNLFSFSETMIDFRHGTSHGLAGKRLYKID